MSSKVISTFSGHLGMGDGPAVFVSLGELFDADHPVVIQHPALFEAAEQTQGTGAEAAKKVTRKPKNG